MVPYWCLYRLLTAGNRAFGVSSPAKPALTVCDPTSTTTALTSSAHHGHCPIGLRVLKYDLQKLPRVHPPPPYIAPGRCCFHNRKHIMVVLVCWISSLRRQLNFRPITAKCARFALILHDTSAAQSRVVRSSTANCKCSVLYS